MKCLVPILVIVAVLFAGNHPDDMEYSGEIGNNHGLLYGVPAWGGYLMCDGDEDIYPKYPSVDEIAGLQDTIRRLREEISTIKTQIRLDKNILIINTGSDSVCFIGFQKRW